MVIFNSYVSLPEGNHTLNSSPSNKLACQFSAKLWKWDLRQDVPEFPCLDLRHFTGPGKDIPLWYPPWNYLGIPLSKWVRNISYPSSVWNIPSCIWLINHLLSEMHFTSSLWWFRWEHGPSIDELWWIYSDLPWFTVIYPLKTMNYDGFTVIYRDLLWFTH